MPRCRFDGDSTSIGSPSVFSSRRLSGDIVIWRIASLTSSTPSTVGISSTDCSLSAVSAIDISSRSKVATIFFCDLFIAVEVIVVVVVLDIVFVIIFVQRSADPPEYSGTVDFG